MLHLQSDCTDTHAATTVTIIHVPVWRYSCQGQRLEPKRLPVVSTSKLVRHNLGLLRLQYVVCVSQDFDLSAKQQCVRTGRKRGKKEGMNHSHQFRARFTGNANLHARRRFMENVKARESGQRDHAWRWGLLSDAVKSEGSCDGLF